MIEAMIDLLFPYVLIIVWLLILLFPERDKENLTSVKEVEKGASEHVCFNALKGLSRAEFEAVPNELKPMIPDKCRFCRWLLCCEPLEMALTTGLFCSGFEERRRGR